MMLHQKATFFFFFFVVCIKLGNNFQIPKPNNISMMDPNIIMFILFLVVELVCYKAVEYPGPLFEEC